MSFHDDDVLAVNPTYFQSPFGFLGELDQVQSLCYFNQLPAFIPRQGYAGSTPGAIAKVKLREVLKPGADGQPREYIRTAAAAAGAPIPTAGWAPIPYGHYVCVGLDADNNVVRGAEGQFWLIRDSDPVSTKPADPGALGFSALMGTGYRFELQGDFWAGWNGLSAASLNGFVATIAAMNDSIPDPARHFIMYVSCSGIPDFTNSTALAHVQALAASLGPVAQAAGLRLVFGGPNEPGVERQDLYVDKYLLPYVTPFANAVHAGSTHIEVCGPESNSVGKFYAGIVLFAQQGIGDDKALDDLTWHTYGGTRGSFPLADRTYDAMDTVRAAAGIDKSRALQTEQGEPVGAFLWSATTSRQVAMACAALFRSEFHGYLTNTVYLFKIVQVPGFEHPAFYMTSGKNPVAPSAVLARAWTYLRRSGEPTVLDMGEHDRYAVQALRYEYAGGGGAGVVQILANGMRGTRTFRRTGGSGGIVVRDVAGNDLTVGDDADFVAGTYAALGGGLYDIPVGTTPTYIEFAAGETISPEPGPVGARLDPATVTLSLTSGTRGPSGGNPVSLRRLLSPTPYDARFLDTENNNDDFHTFPQSMPCSVANPTPEAPVTVTATFPAQALPHAAFVFGVPFEETTTVVAGALERRLPNGTWQTVRAIDEPVTYFEEGATKLGGVDTWVTVCGLEPAFRVEYRGDDTVITGLRVRADEATIGTAYTLDVVEHAGPDDLAVRPDLGLTVSSVELYGTGTGGGGGGGGGGMSTGYAVAAQP